jgi:hypothetical protein
MIKLVIALRPNPGSIILASLANLESLVMPYTNSYSAKSALL